MTHSAILSHALAATSGDATTSQGSLTTGILRQPPSGICSRKKSEPETKRKARWYLDNIKNQGALGRSGTSSTTFTGCRARCRKCKNLSTGPINSFGGKSHAMSSFRSASKKGQEGLQNRGNWELWPSSAAMPSRLMRGNLFSTLANSRRRRHLSGCLSLMSALMVSLLLPRKSLVISNDLRNASWH